MKKFVVNKGISGRRQFETEAKAVTQNGDYFWFTSPEKGAVFVIAAEHVISITVEDLDS